jgi:hypothetical protein
MTRRSKYLLAWGIAYPAWGWVLVGLRGEPFLWLFILVGTGLFAMLGSFSGRDVLDRVGFIALTMCSGSRSLWYLAEAAINRNPHELGGAVLWAAIAYAQLVVAGWPEVTVIVDEGKTGGGVSN